jgi:hypothetical protein
LGEHQNLWREHQNLWRRHQNILGEQNFTTNLVFLQPFLMRFKSFFFKTFFKK